MILAAPQQAVVRQEACGRLPKLKQVVREQNTKKAKAVDYFCKAPYSRPYIQKDRNVS